MEQENEECSQVNTRHDVLGYAPLLDLIDETFRETIIHPQLMDVGMRSYMKTLVRYKKTLMEVFNNVFNTEICNDMERGRLAECVKAKVYLHLSPLSTLLRDTQFAPFSLMMKSVFLAMKNELRKFSHSLIEVCRSYIISFTLHF